jgi:PAS domain S-box-containing protein
MRLKKSPGDKGVAVFRVLLVEDNPGDARLIEEHLEGNSGVRFELAGRAGRLQDALELIDRGIADVVLLDLTLPDSHGRETFDKLHQHAPHLPVIVLSGLDDQELALQLVHEGAQDYLVKNEINHALLTRAMRYALERVNAEKALAHERDLLHTLLDHLPDRIYFKDQQSHFIQASQSLAKLHHLQGRMDVIGRSDFDFFAPEHARQAFEDEQRVMREGQPIINKLEEETWPDGHKTWAITSKLPLRDEHGKIIGTFGISRDITYLKRVEAALAEERDLLHTLLDHLPDRIYFKDEKSRFLRVSKSMVQMHRLKSAVELMGKTDFDLFTREHAQPAFEDEQRVMRTGKPITDKVEKETWADGHITWALTSKMPLRDKQGNIIGTFGLSRDITELKKIEAALAAERNLLNNLINNLPDRIFVKDTQARYVVSNAAHRAFLGVDAPEKVIGKRAEDFIPREIGEELTRADLAIMASGQPVIDQEESVAGADCRMRWHLATKVPLRDHEGKITGLVCITRDITEVKKIEAALAAERNLLHSLINNLPDRIYVKDTQARYLIDNTAQWKFMGAGKSEEMIGKRAEDLLPKEVGERLSRVDIEIMALGKAVINQEESLAGTDGKPRWHLATKVPLRDHEGKVTGLVCISRDITEQKLAEEKLKAANASLSEAVADLKKAHEDLRSVQMQLIEAEKLKSIGRLAAGVAHEVKNPLAIIIMAVDYLSQEKFAEGSNAPAILHDIADAVKRADLVIRGLLDFSAPKRLSMEEGDLNAIIRQSLRLVRGEMAKGKFHVVEELQPDLPRLHMDPIKIGQVFVNLFTNAVHAMKDGGTLTARTYSKQLTGVGPNVGDSRSESFRVGETIVVAEVEDTGHGIPEDKLTKVFEPFYTTKPTGEGSGLGLSVTKTIIDLHGGTISMHNKDTGGVKVVVTFRA